MRSAFFFAGAAFLASLAAAAPASFATPHVAASAPSPVPSAVLAAMDAADAWWTGNNPLGDCNWEYGTFYAGAIAHFHTTCAGSPAGCNSTLLDFITAWAVSHGYECAGNTYADSECCGATYIELYELAPSPEKLALRATLDTQLANFSTVGAWTWVDALFMGLPTWMRFARELKNTSYADRAFQMYLFTAYGDGGKGLWSDAHGLFFRDPSYFNATCPNGAAVFWARGNGWAFAALARAIDALPPGHPYALEFINKFRLMAAALAPLQGTDGLWRASLLDPLEDPEPESTGTGMFVFGYAYGVRTGLLPSATYMPVLTAGWNGLATISQQPDGMVGYCQPVGASPAPTSANTTSSFCTGQFLLAGSEIYKLFSA